MTLDSAVTADPTPTDTMMNTAGTRQVRGIRALSLRGNFCWTLAGNLIYQASQWLNLVVLAKLLSAADVGRFALALAICTPITTIATLNLRTVQVTDAQGKYRFGHFLALQLLTSTIALFVIGIIACCATNAAEEGWVILVVGAGQCVIVVREVFAAYLQKQERMDINGVSMALMGIASLLALGITIWGTGSLLLGVIALQSSKLATFLLWDIPRVCQLVRMHESGAPTDSLRPIWGGGAIQSLMLLALPLGISGLAWSMYISCPRYFIAGYLGTAQLGYFAAIMALVMAGGLITDAAGQSALPRLSRYFLENRRAFARLLLKLIGLGATIGALGIAVVSVAGKWILAVFFNDQYASFERLFLWSMLFGASLFITNYLGWGVTAMRSFVLALMMQVACLGITALACATCIPKWGLIGAVIALIAGRVSYGAIATAAILRRMRRAEGAEACRAPDAITVAGAH